MTLHNTLIPDFFKIPGDEIDCPEDYCFCSQNFYVNKRMLSHKMFIRVSLFDSDTNNKLSIIEFLLETDLGVNSYGVYLGPQLSKLAEQALLFELLRYFLKAPFDSFLAFLEEVSDSHFSTSNLPSAEQKEFKNEYYSMYKMINTLFSEQQPL